MFVILDYFFNKCRPFLQVFALGMFLFSGPLIYYLRDAVGLAKGSSIFTVAMMMGPMILCFPFVNLKKVYTPDKIAYKLSAYFILLGLIYLMAYAPNRGWFTNTYYELGVMIVIAYLYFFLSTVSINDLNKYFVELAIVITSVGGVLFLIYLLRNPYFVIGQRASITFGNSEAEGFGNPHIYAKASYLGIVASILYLSKPKSLVLQIMNFGCIFIHIIILGLTLSMTTNATFVLFLCLYSYFNLTLGKVYVKLKKILLSPVFWIFLTVFIFKANEYYQKNAGPITNIALTISRRVDVLGETFFPFLYKSKDSRGIYKQRVDGSASARIDNYTTLTTTFTKNLSEGKILPILFGNGYHKLYVDVPILEALHSFGIVGFLLFMTFFTYMGWQVLREMKNPHSLATEYIAYAYLYFFLYTFSGGLIIDYIRWGFFAFVCRFLPITFKKEAPKTVIEKA
ncbi:hypothetical protein [Emticicia sp. W12TSBA100-4]|uniref:hypothetical protein n=1 Tax=Emticicia sp. W12TSBA100-4 TaxID=3160965 RepID=UPI0033058FA2